MTESGEKRVQIIRYNECTKAAAQSTAKIGNTKYRTKLVTAKRALNVAAAAKVGKTVHYESAMA